MPRRSSASFSIASVDGTPPRLSPPGDLGELERKAFLDIVLACKPSHFQPSDVPLLAAYCRAIVLERQASNALAVAGHVTEDGRVSPWMKVWEQANKAMLSLAHRLRLSPQGRSPNLPTRPAPTASYYDRMRLMEAARDDAEGS